MGLNGLIKAYHGPSKFGGGWEEDLEKSIRIYRSVSVMCYLSPQDKLKGVIFMLRDDAFDFLRTIRTGIEPAVTP